MQFSKPHPVLQKHLKSVGVNWSSVLDVEHWLEFWKAQEPPEELKNDLNFMADWVSAGAHGKMHFLERNHQARMDARRILESVSSILSLIIPYDTGSSVRGFNNASPQHQLTPLVEKIARYARLPDYHKVIKKELDKVMHSWLAEAQSTGLISAPVEWRVVTDSLPFLDRAHARLAGLGFVGKNTMLIRPGVGSYFFIAHVLLSADFSTSANSEGEKPLAANAIEQLSCGDCRRCLDACPTQALSAPYYLNANKCLSYLSIEHRSTVPTEYISHFAERFYGCDICQEVCPYNFKTTPLETLKGFTQHHAGFTHQTMHDIASMTPAQYEKWFAGTAMTRAKYSGLVRNALYSLYACKDPNLQPILDSRSSDTDPLIKATVIQVLELLGGALNKPQVDSDPQ
ncbi:tRNA epoxyqueuosine(34) reductase QueG [bacterium]|nr:tRNA epoxyqueuosine(34) reductase QueG [bacterium]